MGTTAVATGDLPAADRSLAAARERAAAAARDHARAEERLRAAAAEDEGGRERRAQAAAALERAGVTAEGAAGAADEAAARAAQLDAAVAEAERGLRAEETAVASEDARLGAERAALARDDGELAGARASLGAWAAHEDPAAALGAALEEIAAAERAAEAASDDAARAAAEAGRAREVADGLRAGPVADLRTTAARVAARGSLEPPAAGLDAAALVDAAVRLRRAALEAAARHDAAAARADDAAAAARDDLLAAGAPLGVGDPAQAEGAVRRLTAERDAARAGLARAEEAAASARRLAGEAAAARAEADVHRQVANDLRADRFPRYLLNRFGERLAVGASARLQELTAGAYRFSGRDKDALAVVDMRRGERPRPASTLSGGERFLASLALALGLSDIAAESGGRLDCLFLDEGFSTLDADSLEQALSGVERLAGDGRLIGVITHLPGVADRLGAAIHVRKDPGGSSRIVEP
ncbi:SbcC/MukB-like Walker B domain-containing protein [Miltoncostaea marina]|uniref:SbcC/MukB-like Walker B domain-containing protein n=1 Tax=Miltoncostaea marina TaxID=2843215 RepID=UPI001C3C4D27|nr:SbcC/MukB-like Walker B domain-containing protein [Miltoncostaea marina]